MEHNRFRSAGQFIAAALKAWWPLQTFRQQFLAEVEFDVV
jgi:hypothetical protein